MPEVIKAKNLLERFTKPVGSVGLGTSDRVIDYKRAEDILNVKLNGDETIDDLFEIEFQTRPENRLTDSPFKDFEEYVLKGEKKADGGRVGLFMGGPPLTGQALSIYNSMNAYGFDDQAIADALLAQGLYTPGSSTPVVEEPVTNIAPNIINQGGGDSGPQGIATVPGTYGKEYTGMTMPDGTPIGSMIEMEGPGVIDSLTNTAGNLFGLYQKFSPVGIISKFMKDRSTQQQTLQNNALAKAEAERKAKEAIARAEAEAAALASAQRTGRRPGSGGDGPGTKDSGGPTGGYSYDGGGRQGFGYGLKDGGLAAMFKNKR